MTQTKPREVCYRCEKPLVTCVCANITPVHNRTPVIVLQHPRERSHPVGTARFAQLGLTQARIEVAWNAGDVETEAPDWLPADTGLLYPSPGAIDLCGLPVSERPKHLLVLDGTWHTAHTLYRDKTWLHALPCYRFEPVEPGRYRIRREPQSDYVSTIEAIVAALQALEPETQGFEGLIKAFDAMVDQQIEFASRSGGTKRTRKNRRAEAVRRTPHALVEGFSRLVVLYVESSRPTDPAERELVHLTAVALATGRTFERLVVPASGMPNEEHLRHMGFTQADFASLGVDREQLKVDWAAFLAGCAERPLLCAWNQTNLDVLGNALGQPPSQVSLKGAYRVVHGREAQTLEAAIEREQIQVETLPFMGRARKRLECAVGMARYLNARTRPAAAELARVAEQT